MVVLGFIESQPFSSFLDPHTTTTNRAVAFFYNASLVAFIASPHPSFAPFHMVAAQARLCVCTCLQAVPNGWGRPRPL